MMVTRPIPSTCPIMQPPSINCAFSPPPSMSGSLASPISESGSSAFRPIMPTGENFFLTAIHSFVLSSPNDNDATSESNQSSDRASSDDLSSSLLCQVCSDRASGFHYGVFACEGCKGFFRRSIQQKIQYRPCSRSQECLIVRNNRNRCQYCRLKKCISVGMSRDAVRFGRVPKREKAKMVEEMQRTNAQSQLDSVTLQYENETEVTERIQMAFTQLANSLDSCLLQVPTRCPLQSASYIVAVKAVVDFSRAVPGFNALPQIDKLRMLKTSAFEVLSLCWATRFSDLSLSFLTASPLLAQSLFNYFRRVRAMPQNATAILAAILLLQPANELNSPLATRLTERLWFLLARIGGPIAISLGPGLIGDAKTIRLWHQEASKPQNNIHNQMPMVSAPLSLSIPAASPSFCPLSSPPSIQSQQPSPARSFRERHSSIASLLEKPIIKMEPEVEEQPLNLCVRDGC